MIFCGSYDLDKDDLTSYEELSNAFFGLHDDLTSLCTNIWGQLLKLRNKIKDWAWKIENENEKVIQKINDLNFVVLKFENVKNNWIC